MKSEAVRWIQFLRQYGPIAHNDNMYDETIQRSAQRNKIEPIRFEHPRRAEIFSCFALDVVEPVSVILTGTAGDGKTHLCRQVWDSIKPLGDLRTLDVPHLETPFHFANGRQVTLHIIKDLSEFAPQGKSEWIPEHHELMERFCESLFAPESSDIFLLAANDGALIEAWRRLPDTEPVKRARELFETLLVGDLESRSDARLRFFNLSRGSSALLLDKVLEALLNHTGWLACFDGEMGESEEFGATSPIRHNYDLLRTPLVQKRLRALFELCDYNDLHIPIREILVLLVNAILGHPKCKDRLMAPKDVAGIIRDGTVAKASLYSNLFGSNLLVSNREAKPVFSYLERFRIGYETTNRVDSLLIFGEADENLRADFDRFLVQDTFYGADASYRDAQFVYVEGAEEDEEKSDAFLEQLIAQRRGLFFKIPESEEESLRLWELTVFQYAGEYLNRVVGVLNGDGRVERAILSRLVRGLNRVFTGMLVAGDREMFLTTSLSLPNSRVSKMLEERVSVSPRLGERVEVVWHNNLPALNIVLSPTINRLFVLNLIRYEFLSRVADGALPGSFSKECYEDVLAYKSQLLTGIAARREQAGEIQEDTLIFRRITLDDNGYPSEQSIEVPEVPTHA